MKWISFSFYSSYYYFIIFWVISVLLSLLKKLYENKNKASQKNEQIINSILYFITQIGGDLLAGFLVIYTYLTTDSLTINEPENNMNNKDNDFNYEPSKRIHGCILLLIVSTIHFIYLSGNIIYSLYLNKLQDGEIVCLISVTILSRVFFSHYFLKLNLYNHHCISIILFIIGSFFLGVFSFYGDDFNLDKLFYFLFMIIKNTLIGLEDVLNKFLFTYKFLLPHSLMFYRGLYNTPMMIIFILIMKFSGIEFIFPSDSLYYLLFILSFFIFFFYNFVNMKVTYIFTPQHLSFLNTVYYMSILILYRILNNFSLTIFICEIIILIFMTFSALIFSEMIIINKWGLNKNTKKGLLIRERQEFEEEDNRTTELMNDYEDIGIKEMPEENNYSN